MTMAAPAAVRVVGSTDLSALEWPSTRVPEALAAMASAAGLAVFNQPPSAATRGLGAAAVAVAETAAQTVGETAQRWVDGAGLELETMDIPAAEPVETLRGSVPALVRVSGRGGLLAVIRLGRTRATLVGPGDGVTDVPLSWLEDTLFASVTLEATARLTMALGEASVIPLDRRVRAARLLVAPMLAGRPVAEVWSVRAAATGLREGLRDARLGGRAAGLVVGYLAQFALFLAIWRQIAALGFVGAGQVASASAGDRGWFWFLAFLVLWVIVQVAVSAEVSRLALDVGAVVRATLLRGALRLDPERMRSAGVGQLLGRALDAEALDALALGGGVEAVAGVFELALGGVVLAWGSTPVWSLVVLGVVAFTTCVLALNHARRLYSWGRTRRGLTHDLIERMVGHRTVLIQDRADARARADDTALAAYDAHTGALDRAEVLIAVAVPRAWLLAGLLLLAPVFLSSGSRVGGALAVSVAGVWLVYGAFRRLGHAVPLLAMAREAWSQIGPLIGSSDPVSGSVAGAAVDIAYDVASEPAAFPAAGGVNQDVPPLLVADRISYRYQGRSSLVLNDVTLAIAPGDRVLLTGASGGGKSTLAALLTGLRLPTSGQLRLRGETQTALGISRWRGAVGGAPQFHDNHVLGADLLFNLLMGRRWPPRLQDVADAEQVCRELGLGALLDRMPSGLQQQVGETGWQLSHGERSRLFVARSLLQGLDARVLDESFAALDPQTLDLVMGAVLARPEALIVIAHP